MKITNRKKQRSAEERVRRGMTALVVLAVMGLACLVLPRGKNKDGMQEKSAEEELMDRQLDSLAADFGQEGVTIIGKGMIKETRRALNCPAEDSLAAIDAEEEGLRLYEACGLPRPKDAPSPEEARKRTDSLSDIVGQWNADTSHVVVERTRKIFLKDDEGNVYFTFQVSPVEGEDAEGPRLEYLIPMTGGEGAARSAVEKERKENGKEKGKKEGRQ